MLNKYEIGMGMQGEATETTLLSASFMDESFAYIKEHPPKYKIIDGSFAREYMAKVGDAKALLDQIKPNLSVGLLKSDISLGLTNEEKAVYEILSAGELKRIRKVKSGLSEALNEFSTTEMRPVVTSQILPEGVLATPDNYHSMEENFTCFTACFRMIYHEITGDNIAEEAITKPAKNHGVSTSDKDHRGYSLDEDILLATLRTPIFKSRFPDIQVGVIKGFGTDFDDIKRHAEKIKARTQSEFDTKVFVIPSVTSELTLYRGHNVILLSADESTVTVHDPSSSRGEAYRKVKKRDFLRRWGGTGLASNVVVALKQK